MFLRGKIGLILGLTVSFMTVKPTLFAQKNDGGRFMLSTNVMQIPLNETSLFADYIFKEKRSVGISVGIIYPVNSAAHIPYGNDDTYPGSVWHGWVIRANYRHYYNPAFGAYYCVQGIFKSTHYSDHDFVNKGYLPDSYVYYRRNEQGWLTGLDLFCGNTITKARSPFFIEVFYGLGIRYRVRNYTTLSARLSDFPYTIPPGAVDSNFPLGDHTKDQFYPTLIVGLKMGLGWLTN